MVRTSAPCARGDALEPVEQPQDLVDDHWQVGCRRRGTLVRRCQPRGRADRRRGRGLQFHFPLP